MAEDRNAPATKGDLQGVEGHLSEQNELLRSEIRRRFDEMKATISSGHAELLKAFSHFAGPRNAG
ncbi:MAG: hypothetical protein LAQ69_19310 [Acidobacteriia bacterium]|nr:hypothetical protein [Terriglobia bacterium]